jgi:hypothetical protein
MTISITNKDPMSGRVQSVELTRAAIANGNINVIGLGVI